MPLISLILSFFLGGEMVIKLPDISFSKSSLDEAIYNRKSVRSYTDESLNMEVLSKFLWASYGKNSLGKKVVPSAGAIYPMKIYVVVGNVKDLEQGIYQYDDKSHSIKLLKKGDFRKSISMISYNQLFISKSSFIIIIAASYDEILSRYGERGYRYTYMEAGHIGQNIHLLASSMALGTVMVGAFKDEDMKKLLDSKEDVLYICPVGVPHSTLKLKHSN